VTFCVCKLREDGTMVPKHVWVIDIMNCVLWFVVYVFYYVHLLVNVLNLSATAMMLDYPGKHPLALTPYFPQCMTLLAVHSKSHLSMIQYCTQRYDVIQGP